MNKNDYIKILSPIATEAVNSFIHHEHNPIIAQKNKELQEKDNRIQELEKGVCKPIKDMPRMKIAIDRRFIYEYNRRLPLSNFAYKVFIQTANGKVMMTSKAWSPRKIEARRIAKKLSAATGLLIEDRV